VVPEVLHGGQVAADAVVDHAAVPTLLEPMLGTNESIIYGGKLKSMFKTLQCSNWSQCYESVIYIWRKLDRVYIF
jgi:hypothetical protein